MQKYRLSPSTLNLFLDCPRCFWLEKNKGIKRPRGIFLSLPGGMDLVINELPPELQDKIEGRLFDNTPLLKRWRSWRATDLFYEDKTVNEV